MKKDKKIDLLNNPKYETQAIRFRQHTIQRYAATELAYVTRYLDGELTLKVGADFSEHSLEFVKRLYENG